MSNTIPNLSIYLTKVEAEARYQRKPCVGGGATTTSEGGVRLATQAQALAGVNFTNAITPLTMKLYVENYHKVYADKLTALEHRIVELERDLASR